MQIRRETANAYIARFPHPYAVPHSDRFMTGASISQAALPTYHNTLSTILPTLYYPIRTFLRYVGFSSGKNWKTSPPVDLVVADKWEYL